MWELATLQRQWGWFGIAPGSRSLELRGSTFAGDDPRKVTLLNEGANKLLVSSFRLSPEHLPAIWDAIRSFRPEVVEGWPSSMSLLAGLMRDAGREWPVRGIITSSELVSPAQVSLLRSVFHGPVIDHYGQTERAIMAGGCEAGGYHQFPDYGIMELLPVAGSADEREIVGTPLHNWGFPLFRYRTGDRVSVADSSPCPCGRHFPRFGLVGGRTEALVRNAAGRPIPLASAIIDDFEHVRETQLVQHRPGVFEIRYVPGPGCDRAEVERVGRHNVEMMAGPGQEVRFSEWERLPRSGSGKLSIVIVLDAGGLPDQREESTSA
jgi:phenylacetate-CoA ligase